MKRPNYQSFQSAILFALVIFSARIKGFAEASVVSWHSAVAGRALPVKLLTPDSGSSNAAAPLVIYLKNLSAPRIGTEPDETILRDLRREGYQIAILDFEKQPEARVPLINRDLGKLRDDLRAKQFPSARKLDDAHCYIIPEGYRLRRNVSFYHDPKRTLAMDIIYPSRPAKPVGAILEFSCDNQNRFGNTSLSICSDTILDAQATEGFAVAMADHPVPPPYKGLDAMPDCARKIKAAVRTLRAESPALDLNGNIVAAGFSRGSGMALMLVTTEGRKEFEGFGEHTNISSAVQGAVVMSGRFTYLDLLPDDHMLPRYAKAWGERAAHPDTWKKHGALDYLNGPCLPLFLTINCTESPDALHQMTVLRRRISDLGGAATFFLDREPRGHKVTLDPEILGPMNEYFKTRLN